MGGVTIAAWLAKVEPFGELKILVSVVQFRLGRPLNFETLAFALGFFHLWATALTQFNFACRCCLKRHLLSL